MVAKRAALLFLPLIMFMTLAFGAVSQAYAEPSYVSVQLSTDGNGTVAINNYSYGLYAWDMVEENDSVNITAIPDMYNDFVGWQDGDTGIYVSYSPDIWITANKNINYIAIFKEQLFTIAAYAQPAEGGKIYCGAVSSSWVTTVDNAVPAGYYALDCYPESGYNFMGWYDEYGGLVSYNVPYYFDLGYDLYIHAEFQKVPDPIYYVYLNNANPEGGTVYGDGNHGWYDDWVNIDAVPNAGYDFEGWTETGTGFPVSPNANYTFKIYSDQYYTAHFGKSDAPRTIVTLPGEGSGLMPDYTVTKGDTFYLPECTFIPPYGKVFDQWDVGQVGEGIVINSDMTITALWKDLPYYLVHVEPNGGTGYMPDPWILEGEDYTLPDCTFTGPDGKVFDKWDVGKAGESITIYGETWIYAQWKDPVSSSSASSASASSESASSGSAASSEAASSSSAAASSSSAASSSESAASSTSAASSGASSTDAASSGASSTDASTSSASGSSASSGTGSGSSGTGSGGSNSGGGELPILPIAGGVVVGGGIVALIAGLISRRKKEDDNSGDDGPKGTPAQPTQPIEAAPTEPIAAAATAPIAQQPTVKLPEEEEGFDD